MSYLTITADGTIGLKDGRTVCTTAASQFSAVSRLSIRRIPVEAARHEEADQIGKHIDESEASELLSEGRTIAMFGYAEGRLADGTAFIGRRWWRVCALQPILTSRTAHDATTGRQAHGDTTMTTATYTNLPAYGTIHVVICAGRAHMAYGARITAKARKSLRNALDTGREVVQTGNRIEWTGSTGAKWALVLETVSRDAAIATVEAEFGHDWKTWGNGPGQHRYTPSIIDGASCADPFAMRAALAVLGIPYWDGVRVHGEFAAA